MGKTLIAKGRVCEDSEGGYYLLNKHYPPRTAAGTGGMSLGYWAKEYVHKTLSILLEEEKGLIREVNDMIYEEECRELDERLVKRIVQHVISSMEEEGNGKEK